MRSLGVLLLCLLVQSMAQASNERGNGGSGIHCTQPNESVVLYDHYEGALKSLEFDPAFEGLSTAQVMEAVLGRLTAFNPSRARTLRSHYATFFEEVRFTNDDIIPIPDTGVGTIPAGCKLVQLAAQVEPTLPGDMRYTINKRFWNLMSPVSQAGLILHELLYRELAAQRPVYLPATTSEGVVVYKPFRHNSSKYVRYFNAHLTSKKFASMKLYEYIKLLVASRILTGDSKNGLPIFVSHFSSQFPRGGSPSKGWNVIEFHPNGELKSAYPTSLVSGLSIDVEGFKFERVRWGFDINETYTADPLTFQIDGLPSAISFPVVPNTAVFQFGEEEVSFDQRIGKEGFVTVFHIPGFLHFSGSNHVIRLRNVRTGTNRVCYSLVTVDTATRKITACQ